LLKILKFPGTDNKNWFFEEVNNSYTYPYPEMREALKQNPFVLLGFYEEAFELAVKGKYFWFCFAEPDMFWCMIFSHDILDQDK
jgi:hypothetical protein